MSRYVRVVLTVIAVCLVYLCLRDSPVCRSATAAPPVHGSISTRGITLVDARGRERAHFVVSPNGRATLMFSDARNKLRLVLGLNNDGSPYINMNDDAEARVWTAPPK